LDNKALLDSIAELVFAGTEEYIQAGDARGAFRYLRTAEDFFYSEDGQERVRWQPREDGWVTEYVPRPIQEYAPRIYSLYTPPDSDANEIENVFFNDGDGAAAYIGWYSERVLRRQGTLIGGVWQQAYGEARFNTGERLGRAYEEAGNITAAYVWYRYALSLITGESTAELNAHAAELEDTLRDMLAQSYTGNDVPLDYFGRYVFTRPIWGWWSGESRRPRMRFDSEFNFDEMSSLFRESERGNIAAAVEAHEYYDLNWLMITDDMANAPISIDGWYGEYVLLPVRGRFTELSFNFDYHRSYENRENTEHIHVTADGVRIYPISQEGRRLTYDISGAESLRIHSAHPGVGDVAFSRGITLSDVIFHR
jgi:hypothetical protein